MILIDDVYRLGIQNKDHLIGCARMGCFWEDGRNVGSINAMIQGDKKTAIGFLKIEGGIHKDQKHEQFLKNNKDDEEATIQYILEYNKEKRKYERFYLPP